MYPDPITPRSHPRLLERLDYDPFQVMPADFPPAPRVFATADQLERARQRIADGCKVDTACYDRLLASCRLDEPLPPFEDKGGPPDWGGPLVPWLDLAFRNALAGQLNRDPRHRHRALEAMRRAADAAARVPAWTGHEHHEAEAAARAYDLLAANGLDPADDNAFRGLLWIFQEALDRGDHRACNNHNAMHMASRLSIGAALGHRQTLHDVFYGHFRGAPWRYGLIHLLRHDFLADGMQWEGVPSYHMVVLVLVCEAFTVMEHLGVDLWQRAWPATLHDEGFDEHRHWGPKGTKSLTAAFDALLYQAFANGDYSLLHDQVLGNLRGTAAWWRLFNKAFAVYHEPRYAWALRQINRGVAARADGLLPVWFEDDKGALDFVRHEERDLPDGVSPLITDRPFSMAGRHQNGCSLFPVHGSAILRGDPADPKALGAYFYWGPHCAGHRSPAALHLEFHALGRRVTTAPHLSRGGYGDPMHLTWLRSTIAHNTVTVDENAMFPYDYETDSTWEYDLWRDSISDGVLEHFQPGAAFTSVRASNENVYSGVRLDRTVILTAGYLLDVFRVSADRPRQFDWAMHSHGAFSMAASGEPVALGERRGYRHLAEARLHPQAGGWRTVPFDLDAMPARVALWLDGAPEARLITARDPAVDQRRPIGDDRAPEPRTCLIARSRATAALFVALWHAGTGAPEGGAVTGAADGDVALDVRRGDGGLDRWRLPLRGNTEVVVCPV